MAECITPGFRRNELTGENDVYPCGRCPNCFARRISGWSFRLMQEMNVSTSVEWITLTYAPEHLHNDVTKGRKPKLITRVTKSKFPTLCKLDIQLFFKRVRKANTRLGNSKSIKYFAVGEYGGKTNRPHYHILVYNAIRSTLQESWPLGQIYYGENVSRAAIGYTLKYMSKPSRIPLFKGDDRTPEFSLMSKGLGLSYISGPMYRWHHEDVHNRMYIPIEDGKKIAMPRYYKEWIYHNKDERKAIGISARIAKLKSDEKSQISEWDKLQSDIAKFRKMSIDAKKRDRF